MFNDNFFEDVRIVREEADCEEALERLVTDDRLFSKTAVFWENSWNVLYRRVTERNVGIPVEGMEAWHNLVRPALFLAIRELAEEEWVKVLEHDMATTLQHCEDSKLYRYLRNGTRIEIEMYLLDGTSLAQDIRRGEEEWPDVDSLSADGEFDEDSDATFDDFDVMSPTNTEDEALDHILFERISAELSDKDYAILTADHGDGPLLAAEYKMSEEAIRTKRHRLIENLRKKYELDGYEEITS